jgi:Protein of unknown function (DUF2950)
LIFANEPTFEMEMSMIRNASIGSDKRARRGQACVVAMASLAVLIHPGVSTAQAAANESFASPDAATRALYRAARGNDREALVHILGTDKQTISNEDPLADQRERAQFVFKYDEMHRLARESDGSDMLYVGAENWPFPFPLVFQNGTWRFDSQAGVQELAMRRIGENELAAIDACHSLVGGATGDERRHGAESAARSTADGARDVVFRGYDIRRVNVRSATPANVTTVNASSPQSGIAIIAYPRQYRVTGVMTFVVDGDGAVYQSDLGPNTTRVASGIDGIDSDHAWRRVERP